MNNKRSNFTRIYFIGMAIIIIVMLYYAGSGLKSNNYKYNDLLNDLQNGKVTQLNISQNKEVPTGKVTVKLQDGSTKYVYITDVNQVISDIKDINDKTNQNIQPGIADVRRDSVFLTNILPMLLMGVVIVVVIMMMNANAAGGNSKMANFGKSRAKMVVEVKNMDFSKVAGLKEEKEELEEIVDFLKNPDKYKEAGAEIPKGILLYGPPGTGKTLLAKAVAGEAGVKFKAVSGSDFDEKYVGVGASKMRKLFDDAKSNAPCIIFIDEIDSMGGKRHSKQSNYDRQTLNTLLSEMDGFDGSKGVVILAATNRPDSLDPALLRPGRFDRRIPVELPDLQGREEILKVHAKKIKIADTVRFDDIAKAAAGASGAELANIVNEAALRAVRDGRKFATQADFEVNKTNSRLKNTPYAIQVTGSKVYVEQFTITRDVMDTDIRVYVNKNVLHNIFVYISPNLDALSSTGSQYYFEITTESAEQLASLKSDLRDLGVTAVNVGAAYEQENEEEKQDAASGLYLYLLVIVLLLIIYFFIEKSASIKNSKEYGIYRAIGVNKSNLLFKECTQAVVHNILSFFVFSVVTVALVAVRYAIMNVAFAGFIGLAAAGFATGAVLMTCISLIPYLFVLTESPSEILARYDI